MNPKTEQLQALLVESKLATPEAAQDLIQEADELVAIFVASRKTAEKRLARQRSDRESAMGSRNRNRQSPIGNRNRNRQPPTGNRNRQ